MRCFLFVNSNIIFAHIAHPLVFIHFQIWFHDFRGCGDVLFYSSFKVLAGVHGWVRGVCFHHKCASFTLESVLLVMHDCSLLSVFCVFLYVVSLSCLAYLFSQSPSVIIWFPAVFGLCLCTVGSDLRGLRVPLQISGCALLLTDPAFFSPWCCLIDLVSARLMFFSPVSWVT